MSFVPNPTRATVVEGEPPRGWKIARRVVFGLTVTAILYLELKPEPAIANTPFMPRELGLFFDAHDFLGNFAGFGLLGAVTHFTFCGWRRDQGRRVLTRASLLALGIVALECAQLAIPGRNCDWHDILAGWIGVAMASVFWLRGSRPVFFIRES